MFGYPLFLFWHLYNSLYVLRHCLSLLYCSSFLFVFVFYFIFQWFQLKGITIPYNMGCMTMMIILLSCEGTYKRQDLKIHDISFSLEWRDRITYQRQASNKRKKTKMFISTWPCRHSSGKTKEKKSKQQLWESRGWLPLL